MATDRYVPAAGRAAFTPVYDAVNSVTMREGRWRPLLVEQARGAARILDLGCGTGAMSIALKRAYPDAQVIGIDGDPDVLARARAKLPEGDFREALADALPLPDASVDCVVSTLVFHHLPPTVKRAALAEVRRVLAPDGQLLICDIGRAQDPLMRAMFFFVQLLDGFGPTAENARGALPGLVADAGFEVDVTGRWRTGGGTLELIRGRL